MFYVFVVFVVVMEYDDSVLLLWVGGWLVVIE